MPSPKQEQPILIIGAGLGGLALAHGLQKHNLPFQLFERDDSPYFRVQGYRVRIRDFYLKQLLPNNLWKLFENSCGDCILGGSRLNALTGERMTGGIMAGPPPDQPGSKNHLPAMSEGESWNADRRILRNLMLSPLVKQNLVKFGKRFVRYEIVDDGVMAHFQDGTEYRGRLLVGADGMRSVVRKQLVPDFQVLDTGGRAIFGKTLLTPDIVSNIPREIGHGICLVSDLSDESRPMTLFCDTMEFKNRAKVETELPQDYIYWVLCLRDDKTGMPDDEFLNLSKEQSVELSLELTRSWNPACREILKKQSLDNASTLAFALADPSLKGWQSNGKVTLIGDAAHPMPPAGGIGANGAFLDAVLLLKAVVQGGSVNDIAQYESTMRDNARQHVARSTHGPSRFFGMRPIEELKPWTL